MCCQKTTVWCVTTILILFVTAGNVLAQIAAPATESVTRESEAKIDGTVLLVRERPFFATIIQHNGEPFSFLKSLGFNTIQLPACATPNQLDEARMLGIWIICPPPSSVGLESIPFSYDPVIAWSVAENASARHAQIIRESIREIRASDRRIGRPIVAGVKSHSDSIGRLLDISIIGKNTIGSSFEAKSFSDWIAARSHNHIKPHWIDIPTHATAGLQRQISALSENPPALPIEHQQLKMLLYEAVSAGGRGLRFLSKSRLDANDPATRIRTTSLRWLLRHVDQIEPWASGGLAQQVAPIDDANLEVHTLRMAGSNLVLIQRPTGMEQLTAGAQPLKSIDFQAISTGISDQRYIVDELGTRPMPNQRSNLGTRISLDSCPYTASILVTQDPQWVAHINRASSNTAGQPSTLDLRVELTQQWFSLLQLVEQRLAADGQGFDFVAGAIREAAQQIRNAENMLARGDAQETLLNLDRADANIAFLRRRLIETYAGDVDGIVSSPLLMNFNLIPDHLRLSNRMAGLPWNPNSLAGGDFENLEQMMGTGWINRREDFPRITTAVTLSKPAAADGVYGLNMNVTSDEMAPSFLAAPPVWVKSAEVVVKAGQLVRIHGYVNVPQEIGGSQDGLLITDSLGGPDLASRVKRTDGWQEFTLYRGVARNEKVSITFALTGYGQAMIDEVTIRTIDLQRPPSQANSGKTEIK